jgi:hypothetical protein
LSTSNTNTSLTTGNTNLTDRSTTNKFNESVKKIMSGGWRRTDSNKKEEEK